MASLTTYSFTFNGVSTNVTSTIAAGDYASGELLAVAIQTAMNNAEVGFAGGARGSVAVTYDSGTGKFNWAWTQLRATVTAFIIRGSVDHTKTALATVGIQMGSDQSGSGASGNFDGDYEVRVSRFKFAYAGLAGSVRLADANFTAESFFGITDTTNQTIGAYLCGLDVTDPAPSPSVPSGSGEDPTKPPRGSMALTPFVPVRPPRNVTYLPLDQMMKRTVGLPGVAAFDARREFERLAQMVPDMAAQAALGQAWRRISARDREALSRATAEQLRRWLRRPMVPVEGNLK